MDTPIRSAVITVLASFLLLLVIALIGSVYFSPAPDLSGYQPPARYPVWEDSPDPFVTPRDYFRDVRAFPRKLHLMRPDLIPYPLFIETYA